jgi:hypothetical protein
MRKTLRVSLLVVLLACSVRADDIQNGVTSTPPQAVAGEIQNGVADDIQNGVVASSAESTPTGVFLTLLQSILALF